MTCHDFVNPNCVKKHIKPLTFENCVSNNIVTKSTIVNSKCYQTAKCKSVLYENSFHKSINYKWNNLEGSIECAETVGGYKTALHHRG